MTLGSLELLDKVWQGQQGYVFIPYKLDGRWHETAGLEYPARMGDLDGSYADRPDWYFCPLVFSGPQRRRENALPTHWLWADADEADPRKMCLKPSVAWETSGGRFQALWLLNEDIPPTEAAQLSRRIAYAEGADKGGWDVTQVLRIPGTLNHKRATPEPVRLLWAKRLVRTVEEVTSSYPEVTSCAAVTNPTQVSWPVVPASSIDAAIASLPIGVRLSLTEDTRGIDRSFQLHLLARNLLHWHVAPEVTVHILQRSTLNKYISRDDERQRLLEHVQRAGGVFGAGD